MRANQSTGLFVGISGCSVNTRERRQYLLNGYHSICRVGQDTQLIGQCKHTLNSKRIQGNQILHVCEPPSASLYPALVTTLHRTGSRSGYDHIPHSAGIRARTEGNRIPHCIPYRLCNVPKSYRTRENNS